MCLKKTNNYAIIIKKLGGHNPMDMDIESLAYEEAQRIMEECFSFYNPYTCIIEVEEIPFEQREHFCQLVEDELLERGERIKRDGPYFKILKFQKR